MADGHRVLEDHSKLSLLDQGFLRLETTLTLVGGFVIFLLVLITTTNVLGRWLFSAPISGYIDWVEQAMAFFAFLGLAYTQRDGGHIRMDMLVARLHGRLLWLSELITTLLMLAITLILVYGSYLHFLRAYEIGDSSVDINLPTWPAKLVVPVALSVLALRLLLQIWGYARAIARNQQRPIAVPLIEDVTEVAANEVNELLATNPNEKKIQS